MMLRGIVRCSRFGGYFRFSIQRPLTNTSKRSVFGQTRRNFCTSPAEQKDPSNLLPNQPPPSGPAFFTISRQLGIIILGIVGTLGYGYVEYGSIASAFKTWHTNAKRNFFHFNNPGLGRKFYLLPKVDSIHYTVVIDLKDLIEVIDDKETKKKRALMRPYMDVFLEELANQRYEIVIWSSLDDMSAPEWIEKLDKQVPCFNAVLYFSECTVDGGRVIKDLRRLNRDPKRVINICSSPTIAAYQPENALLIPSWSGDTDDDTTLLDIYMFFLYTAQHCNPITTDVRDLLKKFRNSDVAEAHREVQKQYHDQILQGNKKTKAFIAESKKQVAPKGPISI